MQKTINKAFIRFSSHSFTPFLLEEPTAEIRSVNLSVAIDTGRIREMASPMTFRTQVLDVTTD